MPARCCEHATIPFLCANGNRQGGTDWPEPPRGISHRLLLRHTMNTINFPMENIWHLVLHLCSCEETGINFRKTLSLQGDKSFRTNPSLRRREQPETHWPWLKSPPVNKWSTRGQEARTGPERSLSAPAHLPMSRQQSPKRCGIDRAAGPECFFPQTVAIIIIKQLTPITPSSHYSRGDRRSRSSKGKVRSRVAFAYLNLKWQGVTWGAGDPASLQLFVWQQFPAPNYSQAGLDWRFKTAGEGEAI